MPRRWWLLCLVGLFHANAAAHPSDEWIAQHRALTQWVEATTTGTGETDRAGFFNRHDITQIVTRFATFSPNEQGAVAAPVVLFIDQGAFRFSAAVQLEREDGEWRVTGLTPAEGIPEELIATHLPEHATTLPVRFSLTDADGAEVHARVRITDATGRYWPPDGHQKNIRIGWRQDVGGDVAIAGETFAYVTPTFVARLPEGEFTIEARKGTEYLPTRQSFVVEGAVESPITIPMNRWVDMNARGWYSGDTHTHFLDDHTGMLELQAEDLNVLYVLATKWGELITDVERFTGAPSVLSADDGLLIYNEETRHNWLGHTILHGIDELVYPLTWGGPSEGVIGGSDYPPMAYQADAAHAAGGLVTWAHFPGPGGELAVDIGLDKIDTVDLFTWGDPFAPGTGGAPDRSAVDAYYAFLNAGSRLPATAGTDKMLNVQVSGSVKTYAHIGRRFSYDGWMDALAAGRTFVTTGPVINLTANGKPIGSELALKAGATVELEATVEAPGELYAIERLEIVVGGQVVAEESYANEAVELSLGTTITPTASTWVVARAHGSEMLPYQTWLGFSGTPPMAHTSPIYLTVDRQPVWSEESALGIAASIQAAIDWATTEGNYASEAQRAEVIALYESALKRYQTEQPRRAKTLPP